MKVIYNKRQYSKLQKYITEHSKERTSYHRWFLSIFQILLKNINIIKEVKVGDLLEVALTFAQVSGIFLWRRGLSCTSILITGWKYVRFISAISIIYAGLLCILHLLPHAFAGLMSWTVAFSCLLALNFHSNMQAQLEKMLFWIVLTFYNQKKAYYWLIGWLFSDNYWVSVARNRSICFCLLLLPFQSLCIATSLKTWLQFDWVSSLVATFMY